MKTIVITGATSMIGAALVEAALRDKEIRRIYAVIRPNSTKLQRLCKEDPRIIIIPCELNQYSALPSMIHEKCDVFFHLAWPRTLTYEESYEDIQRKIESLQAVAGAVNVAAKMGCHKFVGAGSQSEYGIVKGRIDLETPCCPVNADGMIHLTAGKLAEIIAGKCGISCIWMRIFSVYGKNDRDNSMIITTVNKLMEGKHCSFTPSEQKWDYLSAEDAGRAFYLAGKNAEGIKTYCLGSGEGKYLRDYIKIIRDIVSPGAALGFGELPYPNDAVINLDVDIHDLEKDTGWSPRISFEDGIQALYDSMKGGRS